MFLEPEEMQTTVLSYLVSLTDCLQIQEYNQFLSTSTRSAKKEVRGGKIFMDIIEHGTALPYLHHSIMYYPHYIALL